MMPGKVYLIGAGPGDAGLLTRKGAEILARAEVVVYDRLIGRDILAMMPHSAELINVGKHAGNHPVPQEQISEILLEKALEGKMVVRLKGGDCFLFGRGGEELEPLFEHNVPFEVVPGVPSPIAATAYAGIPVTHRDFCSSVHFITGHRKKDGALGIDFASLVKLGGTLVFLMSVSNCAEISAGLLAGGMAPDMPCAVIENGTRPEQRKFVSTLSGLVNTIRENKVVSPALIVVGRVCTLSDRFDWFTTRPLHGTKILVTSPAANSARLKAMLENEGAGVTAVPAIATSALDFQLPSFKCISLLAFTSANGVKYFFEKLFASKLDSRALAGIKLAAVGPATAKALKNYGLTADIVPETYSGEALAEVVAAGGLSSGTALLARAEKADPELARILTRAGIKVEELPVYKTVPLPLGHIDPSCFDYVTFTSASCVESFAASCAKSGFSDFGAVKALCIGQKTAAAAKRLGMETHISEKAVLDSMVKYILEASK